MMAPGRRLFNFATVVSLILFLGAVPLWVRSYACWDRLRVNRFELNSLQGITFLRVDDVDSTLLRWTSSPMENVSPSEVHGLRYLIREFSTSTFPGSSDRNLPDYVIVAMMALLPAWWVLVRTRIGRAAKQGLCKNDLRATPQRCPECGTVRADAGDTTLSA